MRLKTKTTSRTITTSLKGKQFLVLVERKNAKIFADIKHQLSAIQTKTNQIILSIINKRKFNQHFTILKLKLRDIFSKDNWSRAVAGILLVAIFMTTIFMNHTANATTYYFSQSSWSGGASGNTGLHPGDQTGWNQYESKDANLAIVNSGAGLQLSTTTNSINQTNNGATSTGFNYTGVVFANSTVSGTGDSAKIKITSANFTTPMVASGGRSGYALKSDGTVWAWGSNVYGGNQSGQLGDNTIIQRNTPIQVHGTNNVGFLTNIISIAAGDYSAYALKSDGTVWSWGYNNIGELGDNSTSNRKTPVQVSGLTTVIAIAGGASAGYALKSDGTVWSWGSNASGQLGNNSTTRSLIPVQVSGLTGITAIAGGYSSAYALKSDGTVWSWGSNASGQLGNNSTTQSLIPVQVSGLTEITAIAGGGLFGYALKSDGTIWSWGTNTAGQLGNNSTTQRNIPVQVSGITTAITISASYSSGYAIKSDGTVWSWGGNASGQLGNNSTTQSNVPVQVSSLINISSISSRCDGNNSNCFSSALKSDGTVWSWGNNTVGQLGNNSTTQSNVPVNVLWIDLGYLNVGTGGIVSMLSVGETAYALKSDGTVWAWGQGTHGELGDNTATNRNIPVRVGSLTGIIAISSPSSGTSAYALKSDGTVWAWGANGNGQLGDSSTTARNAPVRVGTLTGITAITSISKDNTYTSAYALQSDGTVWAWGYNSNGQLGDGSTTQRTAPVAVSSLTGATAIFAGGNPGISAYALKSDNTVWSWGYNASGQLGNNSTTQSVIPVQVVGVDNSGFLSDVTSIAVGYATVYALKTDHTVVAWGNGRLGNNTNNQSNFPVRVLGAGGVGFLSDVISIPTNVENSAYALKSDGTVWAWGTNSSGQLGDGSTTQRNVPVRVGSLTGITAISSKGDGGNTPCIAALKSDGTIWAWGYNAYGQLGDGTIVNKNTPTQTLGVGGVGYLTDVVTFREGLFSYAMKSDGTVWSFGRNATGQLGDDTTTNRSTPVQVRAWADPVNFNAGYISYSSPGTYTSGVLDLGVKAVGFVTSTFSSTLPASTSVAIDVRAGDSVDTNDVSWTAWKLDVLTGEDISSLGSHQYLQYRATLSTTDTSVSPSLNDISLGYTSYPSSQSLTSSAYDSVDSANMVTAVGFTQDSTLPDGTNAILSVRSAPTQGELSTSTWYEFTGTTTHCTIASGVVSCPLAAIPAALHSGNNDRWWQYKITLTSTGALTPTVSGVTLEYVVNAPPELQNISAIQGSDGKVSISYQVKDPDAHMGDQITPTFQFWNGSSWVTSTTAISSLANVDVSSEWVTSTVTWDPQIDFDNHYLTSTKIRIIANDNEPANNLATIDSIEFTVDTINPIVNTFVLDARSDATNNITMTITEDTITDLKMKLSNNSNLTNDTLNADSGTWIDYINARNWVFSSEYTVYYQLKDKYGNLSATSSVALPARPLNILYQDVSNIETSEWREFIAWGKVAEPTLGFKQYNIYRSTVSSSTGYTLVGTSTRINNFFLDDSLDTSLIYYYRVTSEDNSGNVSAYSNTIYDRPDGQGGTDLTPPVISNVIISEITAQSALITWETDEPSDSLVSYIATSTGDFTDAPSIGVGSMMDNTARLGKHSVFLNNLLPGATYWIQVSSADPNHNTANGAVGVSFNTFSGPTISNIELSNLQNSSATISWTTSQNAGSHIYYSTSSTFTGYLEAGTEDDTMTHVVNLSGLLTGQTYYYYVKSGVAEDKNIVEGEIMYYTFTTASDITPPVITFNPATDITEKYETALRISWTTNELATSSIGYSTDTSFSTILENTNFNTDHTFLVTGLTKGTLYNFRINSTDENGNPATLDNQTFLTPDYTDNTPPNITDIVTANQITDTSAVITWTTNEPTNARVDHGKTTGTHTSTSTNGLYNYSHSVILSGLDFATPYYYQVTSADSNGNATTSAEFTFTTLAELETKKTDQCPVSSGGGGGSSVDRTAPIVSEVKVLDINADQVTVTWKTDELANSIVEFGKTITYGGASVNLTSAAAHSQILINLDSEAVYYYKITSIDTFGNLSVPSTGTFTTLAMGELPDLSTSTALVDQPANDLKFADIIGKTIDFIRAAAKNVSLATLETVLIEQQNNLRELAGLAPAPVIVSGPEIKIWEDMAIISWQTDKKTNTLVASAESSDLTTAQVIGNPEIYATDHQVVLAGLKPATLYYYQLEGQTIIGSTLVVNSATFTTLDKAAKVDNYVADAVSDDTASFKWSTSLPTNTSVRVTPYRNNTLSYDEARVINDPKLTSLHQMTIEDLEAGTFYKVDLFGKDATGKTLSQSIEAFSTVNQELPFMIEQVKTNSALSAGASMAVQSIISWNTTKLSTSKVYYRKGTSKDEENWPSETTLDTGYARKHLVVMTDFLPGEVYQFQVESVDSNGQKVRSKTYTILTPRQKESVFQVILKNIEQTFGWMGGSGN